MPDYLGIGELAERSGRSIHTLRYYESIGLMPFVVRDAGGRRRYNTQHVDWLAFLDRLKRTGMTLAQMQEYAQLVSRGKHTLQERIALLDRHLGRVDRELLDLANSRKLLAAKIGFYQEWTATGKYPKTWWLDTEPPAPTATTKKRVRR